MPSEYSKYEETYWWSVVRRRIVLDFLRRGLREGKEGGAGANILDVGCGSGSNIVSMSPLGRVFGVDYSEYEVMLAKDRAGGRVAVADGEHFPFKDGAFDAVTMLDVLEHVYAPDACLRETVRIARPGAVIVITVPAYQFLFTPSADEDHRRRYNARELRVLVEGCGLEVAKLSYFNTLLFPLMLMQRMARKCAPHNDSLEKYFPKYPARFSGLFELVFGLEQKPLRRMNFPFGGSVLCICRR